MKTLRLAVATLACTLLASPLAHAQTPPAPPPGGEVDATQLSKVPKQTKFVEAEYPAAAAALLDNVAAVTELVLPTTALHTAAEATRTELDEQVAASPEVAGVVTALEQQYDAFLATRSESGSGGDLLAGRGGFPTADELGAELERFLADHAKGDQPEA